MIELCKICRHIFYQYTRQKTYILASLQNIFYVQVLYVEWMDLCETAAGIFRYQVVVLDKCPTFSNSHIQNCWISIELISDTPFFWREEYHKNNSVACVYMCTYTHTHTHTCDTIALIYRICTQARQNVLQFLHKNVRYRYCTGPFQIDGIFVRSRNI